MKNILYVENVNFVGISKFLYRMLKMTQVTFVKYKELTVLPYPLKLLKEAAKMSWA